MSQNAITSSDGIPGVIDYVEGNTGGAIAPDGSRILYLLGSGGVSVTGNSATHTLTISTVEPWSNLSGSSTLAINNGYFCISGGTLSLALPAVSSRGDQIEVVLDGSTGFTITQAANQQIVFGAQQTTLGATGTLSSTGQGDSIRLVCRTANLRWVVASSMGNLTFA